jgi:hypothetical protein
VLAGVTGKARRVTARRTVLIVGPSSRGRGEVALCWRLGAALRGRLGLVARRFQAAGPGGPSLGSPGRVLALVCCRCCRLVRDNLPSGSRSGLRASLGSQLLLRRRSKCRPGPDGRKLCWRSFRSCSLVLSRSRLRRFRASLLFGGSPRRVTPEGRQVPQHPGSAGVRFAIAPWFVAAQ